MSFREALGELKQEAGGGAGARGPESCCLTGRGSVWGDGRPGDGSGRVTAVCTHTVPLGGALLPKHTVPRYGYDGQRHDV